MTVPHRPIQLSVAALCLVACGASDSTGPITGGARLHLDAATATHDSVTVAGKVLTASSHGITYTLTIPAGALEVPTRITMTPVTSIDSLPLTQLVGAVDLEPQGLILGKSASLRIARDHSAPSGTSLIGFNFEGDADSLRPQLVTDSSGSITLAIHHFSGGGAAFATLGQIQAFIPTHQLDNQNQGFVDSLMQLTFNDPRDFLAEQNVMREWFHDVVLPAIQNAGSDVQLLFAMSEYDFWNSAGTASNIIPDDPLFQAQRDSFATAALPKLQLAVTQNNTECVDGKDLSFLNNVLYWQTVAAELGLATPDNALDRPGVLAGLCGQVMITDSSYPDSVAANETATLSLFAGLKFGSDPNLSDELFSWELDISGSTADGVSSGLSDVNGAFVRTIIPSGAGPLVIAIKACLFAAIVPYSDVCTTGVVERDIGTCGRVLQGNVTVTNAAEVAALRDVRELTGSLQIPSLTGTGVVDLQCLRKIGGNLLVGSGGAAPWPSPGILHLAALDTLGGTIAIQPTPGLQDLQLSSLRSVGGGIGIRPDADLRVLNLPNITLSHGGAISISGAGIRTVTLGDIAAGTVSIFSTPQLTGVTIASVTETSAAGGGGLDIQDAPALTTISVGRIQAGTFTVASNDALSTLNVAQLTGDSVTGGTLTLTGNPVLHDLAGLTPGLHLARFVFDTLNGFDKAAAFAFANQQGFTQLCQFLGTAPLQCFGGPPFVQRTPPHSTETVGGARTGHGMTPWAVAP